MREHQRHWVAKFESGEYLSKWHNYDPILIGTPYSDYIGIGEKDFLHCVDYHSGIGDVSWWIKSELDKLLPEELQQLKSICQYKTYLKGIITTDVINQLCKIYDCDPFHIHRTGTNTILQLMNELNSFELNIINSSANCMDERTLSFLSRKGKFSFLTFEEYINSTIK
jgi:hypothetical protein